MEARFCVKLERGRTSSQPAARAWAARSVCTWERKATTRTPFFFSRSCWMACKGWLRAFRSMMISLGADYSRVRNASLVVATFSSTPRCLAVSATFIWKNRSSMSATTLPIGFAPPDWQFALCSCSAFDAGLRRYNGQSSGRQCANRRDAVCAGNAASPRAERFEFTTLKETPEEERLASSGPRVVTLYTRPGCHLCEEAKALIAPMLGEFGATLREVNIDEDDALRPRYGVDIPGICS